MPRYKVLSSADKVISVCNLMVIDEEGRIQSIDVKQLTGEGGKLFIGKEIDVVTSNREIIPSDIRIVGATPPETPSEDVSWICSDCGMTNALISDYCSKCGIEKPKDEKEVI